MTEYVGTVCVVFGMTRRRAEAITGPYQESGL